MINRRSFIKSSLLLSTTFSPLSNINAATNGHVVVIGAGWGGLSAAKTLRTLNKSLKITVIEKQKIFKSCPISNWVIGNIKNMNDITFSYSNFINNTNNNNLK